MNANRTSRCFLAAVAVLALGHARTADATVWDLEGIIEFCDALACSIPGIEPGDRLIGFLKADDAVSGPNSSFTEADVVDFLIAVIDVSTGDEAFRVGPDDGAMLVQASLSTDAVGELAGGSAAFFGEFDGGIFGAIPLDVHVDVGTGRFSVATTFLNLGEVANGPIAAALEADGDNVASLLDNCTSFANADQIDSDGDSFGNACDPDHNQDCAVNFIDLGMFKAEFFGANPAFDYTGDGDVNFVDLGRHKALFFSSSMPGPGPSGLTTLCDVR